MANVTKPVILDETGQSIASAISTMSVTSVGNLSALTTTDKTSLVGAVNEVKSGLMSLNSNVSNLGIYAGTVEFTFSNSTMSNNVVIQTATGGVVTSNNILGVSGVLLGDSGLFSLTTNKYQIGCEIPNAYTGTLTALVIFFYAN